MWHVVANSELGGHANTLEAPATRQQPVLPIPHWPPQLLEARFAFLFVLGGWLARQLANHQLGVAQSASQPGQQSATPKRP